MSTLEGHCNAALKAWINTFPRAERLESYLNTLPADQSAKVKQEVEAAFHFADKALDDAARQGPVDIETVQAGLREQLIGRFPWLDADSVNRLLSYIGWYAWHEGY